MNKNNLTLNSAAEVIRAVLKQKISAEAKVVYFYLLERKLASKVPTVIEVAKDLRLKQTRTVLAFSELISAKLIIGTQFRYEVVVPELQVKHNRLMALVKHKSPSVLSVLKDFYKLRKAKSNGRKQLKTDNDFPLMRLLCKKYKAEIVAGFLPEFFESTVAKENIVVTVRTFVKFVSNRSVSAPA
jgi:hypothetical protein